MIKSIQKEKFEEYINNNDANGLLQEQAVMKQLKDAAYKFCEDKKLFYRSDCNYKRNKNNKYTDFFYGEVLNNAYEIFYDIFGKHTINRKENPAGAFINHLKIALQRLDNPECREKYSLFIFDKKHIELNRFDTPEENFEQMKVQSAEKQFFQNKVDLPLSHKELTIAELLSDGYTQTEIGIIYNTSQQNISNKLGKTRKKLK